MTPRRLATVLRTLREEKDLTQEELDRFLKERGLARYKWPEKVQLLDELPLSGPGKVNRKLLSEHARAL